jgi:hypothetical protein
VDHAEEAMPSNKSTIVGSFAAVAPTVLAKAHIELEPAHARRVALPSLSAGDVITINTRNTCYRMQVLDGSKRRVSITGGLLFPNSTEVEVIGASDDAGVRDGFVVEGLQLELSTPRGPILTSMVVTLSVDTDTTLPDHP